MAASTDWRVALQFGRRVVSAADMNLGARPSDARALRRRRIAEAAKAQGGILSRRQLLAMGLTRWQIRAEIRAGRWTALGRQSIRVGEGDPQAAEWWRALLEVGRPAVLDGVSALVAAGLRGIEEDAIHVAVPKSADPRQCRGISVHETRRYEASAVLASGVPRMRPATAAVHAALWARTDREAALLVLSSAQQRLFTHAELAAEILKVRRDRRRLLLHSLLADVMGGIEAIGEQDFAAMCRRRRFPGATHQVWRTTANGRVRLDVRWGPYGVTVEIHGLQHLDPASWSRDALKLNAMSLEGDIVLQIPNVALRLDPEPFLDQVEQALRRGGWAGPAVQPTTSDQASAIGHLRSDVRAVPDPRRSQRPTERAL